jgi:hypothetical protein
MRVSFRHCLVIYAMFPILTIGDPCLLHRLVDQLDSPAHELLEH